MKYEFDITPGRRHSGSYKWDTVPEGVLPMWVADMEFRTAPCVIEALERRVQHGVFGYTAVGDDYYRATIDWFERRHGWTIARDHIIYTSGVVPALSAIIKAMTRPGDKVIVNTPAYNCFFSSIRNNGCELSANPMKIVDGEYRMDLERLATLAADERAKVLILCNPHNPGGRVWTRDELLEVARICRENGVFVISDEIHCELTYPGFDYTPYASLGEDIALNCAVCVSPSKAFNTAGLQIANIVVADDTVRRKVDRAINDNEVCDVNPFGVAGAVAAYNEGGEWLDSLRAYLYENYKMVCYYFEQYMPKLKVMPLQSTYLAWIDCSSLNLSCDEIDRILIDEGGVQLSPGNIYGEGGEGFMRLNFACSRDMLVLGILRVRDAMAKSCLL